MGNEFYAPGEQRAKRVKELFARIAPKYDLINDLQSLGLHRFWKRRVIDLAAARPGELALDLCCGTGDLAFRFAQRQISVVGMDFSPRMLDQAMERSRRNPQQIEDESFGLADGVSTRAGYRRCLTFVQGDALRLPFPDRSFDVVTIAYGLRNLADLETGLREMCRVGRSGARILVLDFGKPDNAVWRTVYFAYLRLIVPMFGLAFCGSAKAYAYILESLRHYPAQQGVAAKMRQLGLANIKVITFLGGVMSINYGERAVNSVERAANL